MRFKKWPLGAPPGKKCLSLPEKGKTYHGEKRPQEERGHMKGLHLGNLEKGKPSINRLRKKVTWKDRGGGFESGGLGKSIVSSTEGSIALAENEKNREKGLGPCCAGVVLLWGEGAKNRPLTVPGGACLA